MKSIADSFNTLIPAVVRMTAAATNVWEVTSERRSTSSTHFRATNFKENLFVVMDDKLKCMVSGVLGGLSTNPNDSNSVVCAHIIPNRARSKTGVIKKLGYTAPDIDCVRNGLFFAYNIEQAFDKLQLCFVDDPHPLTDGLVMKIYDDVCRDVPLYIRSDRFIGEFDGCALTLGDHLTFRSALCFHAYYTFLEVDFGATVDMPQLSSSPERVTYLSQQIRLHLHSIDRSIDTTFEDET
jgi:HNH endonuclease